jgi:hypothetical protein
VDGGGGAAPRRAAGDGGSGMALIWGRSSPLPRRGLRAGGDGGGVANPEPGGAILSFRPSLGIAGPAVMETDLALLLLKVWDHGTKGGGPGWRRRCRPGGRWRASGATDRGTVVVVFSLAGGDRLVVWLAVRISQSVA